MTTTLVFPHKLISNLEHWMYYVRPSPFPSLHCEALIRHHRCDRDDDPHPCPHPGVPLVHSPLTGQIALAGLHQVHEMVLILLGVRELEEGGNVVVLLLLLFLK